MPHALLRCTAVHTRQGCGHRSSCDACAGCTRPRSTRRSRRPTSADSDGDGCGDRREIASINGDLTVNSIDLGQISAEVGTYTSPGSAVKVNFDLTKDGAINVIDVNLAAAALGACP
jgi:hypothetical protein